MQVTHIGILTMFFHGIRLASQNFLTILDVTQIYFRSICKMYFVQANDKAIRSKKIRPVQYQPGPW